MKINSIKTCILGFLLAGSSAFMSGCSSPWNNSSRLHQYMSDRGDKQAALDSILDLTKNDDYVKESILRQSAVDSIAYRDLFLTSRAAKVPAMVSEFNKIAAKASLLNAVKTPYYSARDLKDLFLNKAKQEGIIIVDADKWIENFPDESEYRNTGKFAADAQQHADKYFYSTFFRKNRLLGGDFKVKFDSIAGVLKR